MGVSIGKRPSRTSLGVCRVPLTQMDTRVSSPAIRFQIGWEFNG